MFIQAGVYLIGMKITYYNEGKKEVISHEGVPQEAGRSGTFKK